MSWGCFAVSRSILLTLRHNLTQELLVDIHTVSQSTISRVVAVYTPLITEALQAWVPGVEDLDPDRQYIIDGTLGVLLVVARPSRTVLRQTPHDRSEPAGGLHPGRTARLDPQNHQQAVCMTQRPSRNPDSSQPSMLTIISGTRATSDWE